MVAVAMLAREGGLPDEDRRAAYEGGRVRGNMLPDVLTSQLRDVDAAVPVGQRVVRIATHHAVRSRGLGSHLLDRIHDEFADEVDWLGVGYGATPDLLRFWRDNDYGVVHLSTTRNDTSGEYSALMLRPTSEAGQALHDRHADWFAERVRGLLSDPLRDLDPDVARTALRATDAAPDTDLSPADWRVVVGASYGAGISAVSPGAFRPLAVAAAVEERGEFVAVGAVVAHGVHPVVPRRREVGFEDDVRAGLVLDDDAEFEQQRLGRQAVGVGVDGHGRPPGAGVLVEQREQPVREVALRQFGRAGDEVAPEVDGAERDAEEGGADERRGDGADAERQNAGDGDVGDRAGDAAILARVLGLAQGVEEREHRE